MTKEQIKAELRRSACEDKRPFDQIHCDAFLEAELYCSYAEFVSVHSNDNLRTFFLLVAEAL